MIATTDHSATVRGFALIVDSLTEAVSLLLRLEAGGLEIAVNSP
jgi:hypothetical protein